jgi:RNA polymerase sigma-70 factor (ECF subfamily)
LHSQEAEWLARAQTGDDEAFSYLVEAYQVPVYNLCYRMLGNAGDAEDAAQESFFRAYKAIKRYDPSRKFSTWLLTIASNYCIDQHRRRRLPTFSIEETPTQDFPDRTAISPDNLLVRNEQQAQVRKLLESLSSVDRAAVVLRYWYDYSYEEIASALSLSVSAVKSRLHRARRDLAIQWNEREPAALVVERTGHESSTL